MSSNILWMVLWFILVMIALTFFTLLATYVVSDLTKKKKILRSESGRVESFPIPASFTKRFMAYTIDGIILTAAIYLVTLVVCELKGDAIPSLSQICSSSWYRIPYLIVSSVYFGYFYSTSGATPGKRLLRLKVIDVTTKTFPTFWKAFLRGSIGYTLSSIFVIGFLVAVIRDDQKALHDLIFRTQVLEE